MYSMSISVVFWVFHMTFSNLKNSVNTGNGILEAVDSKLFLGSMPLQLSGHFSRLGRSLYPSNFCYGWPPLTTSSPSSFLSFRRPWIYGISIKTCVWRNSCYKIDTIGCEWTYRFWLSRIPYSRQNSKTRHVITSTIGVIIVGRHNTATNIGQFWIVIPGSIKGWKEVTLVRWKVYNIDSGEIIWGKKIWKADDLTK